MLLVSVLMNGLLRLRVLGIMISERPLYSVGECGVGPAKVDFSAFPESLQANPLHWQDLAADKDNPVGFETIGPQTIIMIDSACFCDPLPLHVLLW
jgi:hypothetical protein